MSDKIEKREKRMNNGYEIIQAIHIKNEEIVIGYNENAPNPYVCWYCINGDDYYWGYYCNEISGAIRKMNQRRANETRYLRNIGMEPPNTQENRER